MLTDFSMWSTTSLLVVSDHGLAATNHEKFAFFDDDLQLTEHYEHVLLMGAYALVYPRAEHDTQLYQLLTVRPPHRCAQVYAYDEWPQRWHPTAAGLTGRPLLVLCEPGYALTCVSKDTSLSHLLIRVQRTDCKQYPSLPPEGITISWFPRALAGYDNAAPQMKAVFLARGRGEAQKWANNSFGTCTGFASNTRRPWLAAVDVHDIVCQLLQLNATHTNASPARVGAIVSAAVTTTRRLGNDALIVSFCTYVMIIATRRT
jgi:hypothetical protein